MPSLSLCRSSNYSTSHDVVDLRADWRKPVWGSRRVANGLPSKVTVHHKTAINPQRTPSQASGKIARGAGERARQGRDSSPARRSICFGLTACPHQANSCNCSTACAWPAPGPCATIPCTPRLSLCGGVCVPIANSSADASPGVHCPQWSRQQQRTAMARRSTRHWRSRTAACSL